MSKVKIFLAQINLTVGDLDGNCFKILQQLQKADAQKCDLIIFPEMAICGYPCEDLWHKKYFITAIEEKILEILQASKNSECAMLLGAPTAGIKDGKKETIHNSALLIKDGEIKKIINKRTLPNFAVFDEYRYFQSARVLSLVEFCGMTLAILVCEDLWDLKNLFLLQEQIFDAAIVINASPYSTTKQEDRYKITGNFAKNLHKPLIYLNQIGGQDCLVFDGSSFVLDNQGKNVLQLKEFQEDFAIVELTKEGKILPFLPVQENFSKENFSDIADLNSAESKQEINEEKLIARDYMACILGLRDYVKKNNFTAVLLGMSGGIDSALAATIAADALGPQNVMLLALPSRFNPSSSLLDAKNCAANLKINLKVISIEPVFAAMLSTCGPISEITKENIQARIRGNILMAFSNDCGALLISTGNKSELACGYATLYGDMCGAFNPIKDLYKTRIYELAKWRNQNIPEISLLQKNDMAKKELISQSIINKAPTAELRPDQKDSDSLPAYEILDQILFSLIEEQKSVAQIIESGFAADLVQKVAKLFYSTEYKRRQSCLGPKISNMAFDKDRRYPITNKFTI
jgi:NAD+ synthetase